MIKIDRDNFVVKSNKELTLSFFLLFTLVVIQYLLPGNYISGDFSLYFCCSLIMILLITRINRRQVAYYWIKKNKLSKLVLLKFESEYIPLRFYVSHLYAYVQFIVIISLYGLIYLDIVSVNFSIRTLTFWIIGVFNLIPFLLFAGFEMYEDKKCKDL